jgi:hypothetical protein
MSFLERNCVRKKLRTNGSIKKNLRLGHVCFLESGFWETTF